MIDIKKGDEIFISYVGPLDPTATRQADLASYGFQCTCASCSSPGFDHLQQKVHDRVFQLSESIDKWIQDRSLPEDHVINPALDLLSLMQKNGLYTKSIYELNLSTLFRCYSAIGDYPNTMKYSNLLGLWYLAREGNSELHEASQRPQTYFTHPGWRERIRV